MRLHARRGATDANHASSEQLRFETFLGWGNEYTEPDAGTRFAVRCENPDDSLVSDNRELALAVTHDGGRLLLEMPNCLMTNDCKRTLAAWAFAFGDESPPFPYPKDLIISENIRPYFDQDGKLRWLVHDALTGITHADGGQIFSHGGP